LNYLELMDSCMDNLTNKSNLIGCGNPFNMGGSTLFNHGVSRAATKGVFKETRLPKYKNAQYMSKRQQLQRRQQIKQYQGGEHRDVSNLESSNVGTP